MSSTIYAGILPGSIGMYDTLALREGAKTDKCGGGTKYDIVGTSGVVNPALASSYGDAIVVKGDRKLDIKGDTFLRHVGSSSSCYEIVETSK
jgi:hypothetical protein